MSAPDDTVALSFDQGMKHVTTSDLSVFDATPSPTRYAESLPISSITCAGDSGPVDCSGDSGLVTSATLTVPGLQSGTTYEVWANQYAVTPQLIDASGNAMPWNFALG